MKRLALFFASLAMMCAGASAASIFSFDQAVYTVTAGGTVSIPVYLQLDDVGTSDYSNMVSDSGMFSIGVRLTEDPSVPAIQATQIATIASMSDVQANTTDFDAFPVVDYVSTTDAGLMVFAPGMASGPQFTTGQPAGRFLIGNFVFTAGNVVGETTNYNATDLFPSPSDDTVTFNAAFVLDPTGSAPVSITVVPSVQGPAVPIPAASWAGLVLLAALGLARLVRWRRM